MGKTALIGALAIGLSLPLLWWSVAGVRGAGGGSFMARFLRRGEATTDMRQIALAQGAGRRVVVPALRGLVRRIKRVTPVGWVERMEGNIRLAGLEDKWPIEKVLVVNVVTGVTGLVLGYLQVRSGLGGASLIAAALSVGIGVFGPDTLLVRWARLRQETIERELPDALDQITMGVEAGLGFEGALMRAAEAGKGPLAQEFRRALKEMHIGVSRGTALKNLSERTDVIDLDTLVVAVTQAEAYGLPIANVLRVQSSELRTKRRQRAEERALKVPIKLIFPLGLCIFPALFIVLIGPGVIRIWRVLGL